MAETGRYAPGLVTQQYRGRQVHLVRIIYTLDAASAERRPH